MEVVAIDLHRRRPVLHNQRGKIPYHLLRADAFENKRRPRVETALSPLVAHPATRALLRGVIAGGNRNFGTTFALAGDVISKKCGVPVLYRFELAGTDTDVTRIRSGLDRMRDTLCPAA